MEKTITFFILLSLSVAMWPVSAADTATLSFSPSQFSVEQTKDFTVTILVNTGSVYANAVGLNISFPQEKLEARSISTAGSVLTIFAEKEISDGLVTISGGTPTPGFAGQKTIASVTFRAKVSSGSAQLKFVQESVVLKNSDNTNFLSLSSSGTATVNFKAVSTPTEPGTQDTTPPSISNILIEDLTKDSATISWQTDENSDSQMEYGFSPGQYNFTWADPALVTEHRATIGELPSGETFYFVLSSKDEAGNEARSSEQTFTLTGYKIEIVFFKENGQPAAGCEVSLLSGSDKTDAGVTDKEGKVVFENVVPGKATVSATYKDTTLSKEITISPDKDFQSFEFVFPAKKLGYSPGIYAGLGVSVIMFFVLLFLLIKIIKGPQKTLPR